MYGRQGGRRGDGGREVMVTRAMRVVICDNWRRIPTINAGAEKHAGGCIRPLRGYVSHKDDDGYQLC